MTAIQQLNVDTDEVIDVLAMVEILHDYFLNKGEIGKWQMLKLIKKDLVEIGI